MAPDLQQICQLLISRCIELLLEHLLFLFIQQDTRQG
jgi:hypothetical protein